MVVGNDKFLHDWALDGAFRGVDEIGKVGSFEIAKVHGDVSFIAIDSGDAGKRSFRM